MRPLRPLLKILEIRKNMALHVPIRGPEAERLATDLLKNGSVIAVPTDTVYGLACDATNITSIGRLYQIKARNEEKPVAICLGDTSEVKIWAKTEHLPQGLVDSLLPGPVTLIITCANKLDKSLSTNGKVGIRIPDCDFIRVLARGLGRPLALTSANISSKPSSLTVDDFKDLWGQVGAVFNGGTLSGDNTRRLASTVVDLSEFGVFSIVRQGVAALETIKVLCEFGLTNKNH